MGAPVGSNTAIVPSFGDTKEPPCSPSQGPQAPTATGFMVAAASTPLKTLGEATAVVTTAADKPLNAKVQKLLDKWGKDEVKTQPMALEKLKSV